jgi:hypothetical protein
MGRVVEDMELDRSSQELMHPGNATARYRCSISMIDMSVATALSGSLCLEPRATVTTRATSSDGNQRPASIPGIVWRVTSARLARAGPAQA